MDKSHRKGFTFIVTCIHLILLLNRNFLSIAIYFIIRYMKQGYQYGKIVKNSPATQPEEDVLNTLTSIEKDGHLILKRRVWIELGLSKLCRDFQTWNIEEYLDLGNNQTTAIIHHISHISFPKLLALNLSQNCLASIQILNRLELPVLNILSVQKNYLSRASSLGKCVLMKNLTQIYLGSNYLQQMAEIARVLPSHVKHLNILEGKLARKRLLQEDYRWICKFLTLELILYNQDSSSPFKHETINHNTYEEHVHRRLAKKSPNSHT